MFAMNITLAVLFLMAIHTASSLRYATTKSVSRDPIAIERANNLLQSMADTLNGRSTENIADYMDRNFKYDRCNNEFSKDSSLTLLESYPTKDRFTFFIIDARFDNDNLIYKVTIKDFGPKFTAVYTATSDDSLRGKYRLLHGEELSCRKTDDI